MVVSTGAINCLGRLITEMTYYVLSWLLNHSHLLTNLNNAGFSFVLLVLEMLSSMHWSLTKNTHLYYFLF